MLVVDINQDCWMVVEPLQHYDDHLRKKILPSIVDDGSALSRLFSLGGVAIALEIIL